MCHKHSNPYQGVHPSASPLSLCPFSQSHPQPPTHTHNTLYFTFYLISTWLEKPLLQFCSYVAKSDYFTNQHIRNLLHNGIRIKAYANTPPEVEALAHHLVLQYTRVVVGSLGRQVVSTNTNKKRVSLPSQYLLRSVRENTNFPRVMCELESVHRLM